jgi:hypothetical protein
VTACPDTARKGSAHDPCGVEDLFFSQSRDGNNFRRRLSAILRAALLIAPGQGAFDEVAERADLLLGGLAGGEVADRLAGGEGAHEDRAVGLAAAPCALPASLTGCIRTQCGCRPARTASIKRSKRLAKGASV